MKSTTSILAIAGLVVGIAWVRPVMSGSISMTICHNPNHEPATETIDDNGWFGAVDHSNDGHQAHQRSLGDYIGSCNHNDQQETLISVVNCQDTNSGTYRSNLLDKLADYNSPILLGSPVVLDHGYIEGHDLSTVSVIEAYSHCVDENKGDGIDAHIALGSDDYIINMRCKNKSASETYRYNYRHLVDSYYPQEYVIVPDAALDNSAVKSAYDDCTAGSGGGNEAYHHKSDGGFNFRVIIGCNTTPTDYRQVLVNAISAYQADVDANTDLPIILTKGSLDDYQVRLAYEQCLDSTLGGGQSVEADSVTGFGGRLNWREKTGR